MLKNIKDDMMEAKNMKYKTIRPDMLHAILKFENLNNLNKEITLD